VFVWGTEPILYGTETAGENNNLTISQSGSTVTFTDPGAASFSVADGCFVSGTNSVTCPAPSPSFEIEVKLGPGNDFARALSSVTAPIRWERIVTIGQPRGPGNDTYIGGAGPDYFYAEVGGDNYTGGGGTDRVIYDVDDDHEAGVSVTLDDVANDGIPGEQDNVGDDIEQVIGTVGPDSIKGSGAGNFIVGLEGADLLEGGGGPDLIYGDAESCAPGLPGPDTLEGGAGNDDLFGCGGDDILLSGADTAGPDADVFNGGAGTDSLSFASRSDSIDADLVDGEVGEGDEVIGVETLLGGSGHDALAGNNFNNTIVGGPGNDLVEGLGGTDVVDGGPGNDNLYGDAGSDDLRGGGGLDAVYEYATAAVPVTVRLDDVANDGPSGSATDNVRPDVEVVLGGAAGDYLAGSGGANQLLGNNGGDFIDGAGGDDVLSGLGGPDQLIGGAGVDDIQGGLGDDLLQARDSTVDSNLDCGGGDDELERDTTDPPGIDCEAVDPVPGSGDPPGGPSGPGGSPSTPAPPPAGAPKAASPSNAFRLRRPIRNLRRGLVTLRVVVPGPGLVDLVGSRRTRPARRRAQRAGVVKVPVRVRPRFRKALRRPRGLSVSVRIVYVPDGGAAGTRSTRVKLVQKLKK